MDEQRQRTDQDITSPYVGALLLEQIDSGSLSVVDVLGVAKKNGGGPRGEEAPVLKAASGHDN